MNWKERSRLVLAVLLILAAPFGALAYKRLMIAVGASDPGPAAWLDLVAEVFVMAMMTVAGGALIWTTCQASSKRVAAERRAESRGKNESWGQ